MYLEVKDLKKSYGSGEGFVQVLKGITTGVEQGDMCVIQGTSGSGKSTFLNCVGGLDTIDSGSVIVDGKEIAGLNQTQLSEYSRDILVLLETINEKYGTTMLIVTHNNSIKDMVHKVIRIKDGQISKEYYNETRVPAAELEDL